LLVPAKANSAGAGNHVKVKPMARILIIDDDEPIRRTLRRMLELAGYDVVEAADGREGVELYKADSVDLVLTDLIMPEKEGIQAAAELRHYDPEVKIIAISGGGRIGNFQVLKITQKFGIEHALPKPIRLGKLLALVEDVLDENA
jgi:DNA-binding NtrC family response regulator